MLYNGYLVPMETYVTLFSSIHSIQSIGPINVCTNFEINQYKIDEFRKHAKIACFIRRYVMQKRLDTSDRYFRKILKPTRSLYGFRLKNYGSKSGFHVFGDLDFCSIFCYTHWA